MDPIKITNKSGFFSNLSGAGMLVTIMLLMDGLRYILPEDLKDRPRIGEKIILPLLLKKPQSTKAKSIE